MYLTVWIVLLCLKYILVDNFFKKIYAVLSNAKLSVFSEELPQCLERIYILLFKHVGGFSRSYFDPIVSVL